MNEKILIVEDEAIVAMDISNRLLQQGYQVIGTSPSGEDAIERVAEHKPDLVLMDIRLQGKLDGVDTAKQIWTRFQVPVIFLTAHSDEPTVSRAKIAEPFGYLLKPFGERELKTTIELALYKHKVEEERREIVSDIIVELSKSRPA